MIARLLAIVFVTSVAVAAQSSQPVEVPKRSNTPERPRPANGSQSDRAKPSEQNAQPTITVVVPEKSPEQLKADAEQRQREIAIQEDISSFTGWLVLVGVAQVVLVIFGFIWTRRAANAAQKSADAANDSASAALRSATTAAEHLKLSRQPTVDIRNLRVISEGRTLTLRWNIYNAGTIPVKFWTIGSTYRLPNGGDVSFDGSKEISRGPDRGFDYDMDIDLSEADIALYLQDRLVVALQIRIELADFPEGTTWRAFCRRVYVDPRRGWVSHLENENMNGWGIDAQGKPLYPKPEQQPQQESAYTP